MIYKELDKNKKKLFTVMLAFTVVAGIGFSIINYLRGQNTLASVELVTAIISFILLLYVKKINSIRKFKRSALIFVAIFFSIMMFAISLKGVSITILAWVLIIPLVSYLLLGVKAGFTITAFYYTISTVIFFTGFNQHPAMNEKVAYANIIVCALLFWSISHSYESASKAARRKLRKMAVSDYLTGLYNRTSLNYMFDKIVTRAEQEQDSVSFVLFDLDGFKGINDEFGHDTGDQVLIQFAQIIKSAVANNGVAFRIGGEEFAVIFSAQSSLMILSTAENIRRDTEKIIVNGFHTDLTVSVSAGVVIEKPHNAKLSEMMKTADRRMYQGKNQGRNVVIHKG